MTLLHLHDAWTDDGDDDDDDDQEVLVSRSFLPKLEVKRGGEKGKSRTCSSLYIRPILLSGRCR